MSSGANDVTLIDLTTNEVERRCDGLPGTISSPAVSHDGAYFAIGTWQARHGLNLYGRTEVEPLATFDVGSTATRPAFGRSALFVSCSSGQIIGYDLPSLQERWTHVSEEDHSRRGAGTIAVSPDGAWVAFMRGGHRVQIVDAVTGEERWMLEPSDHDLVTDLEFSASSGELVVSTASNRIDVWQLAHIDQILLEALDQR